MRHESSVTSITWIPSEAVSGLIRSGFELLGHYDSTPPDGLTDLGELQHADRFRFANQLEAWIEVEDGRVVGHGQTGRGWIGSTTLHLGSRTATVAAVQYPDLRPADEVAETSVRFVQTAGGRIGVPLPRPIRRPPFVAVTAPPAWTTLALTIHADGSSRAEMVGASPFPRHWIYDHTGDLVEKTGVIDFETWIGDVSLQTSPWNDTEMEAVTAEAVREVEREVSARLMAEDRAGALRVLEVGEVLVDQGSSGTELYLVLDGVLDVSVDGTEVARVGPGAVLGERALLEGGHRTSTLRAASRCRVAVFPVSKLEAETLAEVRLGHQREARTALEGRRRVAHVG